MTAHLFDKLVHLDRIGQVQRRRSQNEKYSYSFLSYAYTGYYVCRVLSAKVVGATSSGGLLVSDGLWR